MIHVVSNDPRQLMAENPQVVKASGVGGRQSAVYLMHLHVAVGWLRHCLSGQAPAYRPGSCFSCLLLFL